MKHLALMAMVAGLVGCATIQPPTQFSDQSQSSTYDRWAAVQQRISRATEEAASAGEDPAVFYARYMNLAANTLLHDADPKDWAWRGMGPRPPDAVFQRDRYRCLQVAKQGISAMGGKPSLYNLGSGFDGAMGSAGWTWQ